MNIDEAVVISRLDRPERLTAFMDGLPDPSPFPAFRLAEGVVEEPPSFWKSGRGAWGCRRAHLDVLQDAWERGVETLAVFEDDATFVPGFARQFEDFVEGIPPIWSMVMLGGQHISEPLMWRGWARCRETRRTHAYIIRIKAMPLLIRTWRSTNRHIDHALPEFQRQVQVYAPSSWLVGQRAGVSDISGVVSPEDRFWLADEHVRAGFVNGKVPL